jgi:hypothetical protein
MSLDPLVSQLTESLLEFGLKPTAIPGSTETPLLATSALMQWSLEIAPNLLADLTLIRTSQDDHLLNLVLASESAHDETHWQALDLYAREMGKAVRPVSLLRIEAELSCFVQGRAKGFDGTVALIPELVAMLRYALITVYGPWLDLARGKIDLETAGMSAASEISRQIGDGA